MIVWLRQLASSRGEEDMLVQGYHTASQLVASEWIGRMGGWEPQVIPRWPGVNHNFRPPTLEPDEPFHWQHDPDDQVPRADINHWIFDAPNGARNGNELFNPGPLQIPCPNILIGQAFQQAMLAWERARDAWLHQPQRQGEMDREAENYPFPPPHRPQPPEGSVRTHPRPQVWGDEIHGIPRLEEDNRPGLDMQRNPERLTDAEWFIVANEANCYRALTPFYECNLLLVILCPRIVVLFGGGLGLRGLLQQQPLRLPIPSLPAQLTFTSTKNHIKNVCCFSTKSDYNICPPQLHR